jgi:ubiquinone/menaquinone biosynthesis C-methylase UbiE
MNQLASPNADHVKAPAAGGNGGFDSELFGQLAQLEERNFWFRSRNRLINWCIKTYFPACRSFIEIGCGTGFVLSDVRKNFPSMQLTGSELFEEGLVYARKRLPGVRFIQLNAEQMPFDSEFDLMGAFDVLEHITADVQCLREAYRALKPGGGLLITVPQHSWLWSRSDELAQHVRRYSRQEMLSKLRDCGFEIERTTSFVSLLLPLMYASRQWQRLNANSEYSVLDELRVSGPTNTIMEWILGFERRLITCGADLPLGGSLLVVARKPG